MNENRNYGQKVSKAIHRTDCEIDIFNNNDSQRRARETSRTTENQHILPAGKNWSGGDISGSNRGTISGGIIRQLIQEADDQLKESIARVKKLQQRKEQLMQLFHELSEKTGETGDDIDGYLGSLSHPQTSEEE